jgi:hypothetical protein
VIRRIPVLTCSTRAFDNPLRRAASTLERCSVIVFGELDEWLQAASSGPFDPAVKQLERLLVGDVVDLAQLLLE